MNPLPPLQTGDVLLYRSRSFVGWAIRERTWSGVEHVEICAGEGVSGASRNGIGVNLYPHRSEGLAYVLRPKATVSRERLMSFINKTTGTPYGWFDLLSFFFFGEMFLRWLAKIGLAPTGKICSQWADEALRECGIDLFNVDYPDGEISPRDYLVVAGLTTIWKA